MRGFALTAHCPRCGTEKPTGGDVAPLVACTKCGLSFDPKPREPRPRKEPEPPELPISTPLVDEEFDERHALLIVRDSRFGGIALAGLSGFATWGMFAASYFFYAPLIAIGAYAGISKLFGRTEILVTVDAIDVTQHPLPRRPRRTFDDPLRAAKAIGGEDAELVRQIDETIRKHRARLLALLPRIQD